MPKILPLNTRNGAATKTAGNCTIGMADPTEAPWSGALNEEELSRPGGLLLAALIQCAVERGQKISEMASHLGVTHGYINQLRNGLRNVYQVSDEFALACARYLMLPRLTVLMLAGRISVDDLFESRKMMAADVSRAMAFLHKDPEWSPLLTNELRQTSTESQFALIRLYEQATGRKLLSNALRFDSITEEIHKLQSIQAARLEAINGKTAPQVKDK